MTDSNMEFWNAIEETDPRFTKKQTTGARLTSINGQYQFKKMTQLFGPCGLGWGFETTSSEFIETGPILSSDNNLNGQPIQLDMGQLHTLRIKLWYLDPDTSEKLTIEGVGHTPFKYGGKRDGNVIVFADMEYEKKSLTDALTNAMAKLGMAADVRMGMFDMPDYVAGLYDDIAIDEAGDAEAAAAEQRHEFEEWFKDHIELMQSSVSVHELEKLFKGARPRIERQGSPDQKQAHVDVKNARFRELMPRKEK